MTQKLTYFETFETLASDSIDTKTTRWIVLTLKSISSDPSLIIENHTRRMRPGADERCFLWNHLLPSQQIGPESQLSGAAVARNKFQNFTCHLFTLGSAPQLNGEQQGALISCQVAPSPIGVGFSYRYNLTPPPASARKLASVPCISSCL